MRKYFLLGSLGILTVFLAGCSLSSSSTTAPDANVKKPSSVMKSVDGGKTWEAKNDAGAKINLDAIDVLSMSINPQDGKNIFVGTLSHGILESKDGGENWTSLNFPVEKVYGLVNDYVDGKIIYASGVWQGRGKLFKSLNGGVDWDEIYTVPSNGPLVVALTIDKNNSNILFLSTSDKQLIKSVDAGVSWKNIYNSSSPILKIAIDNVNSNLIYINTQSGDFNVSRDGGITFGPATGDIEKGIDFVVSDPVNTNRVYVSGKAGIFRSEDAGSSWKEIKTLGNAAAFPVRSVAINPENSREIVYGAGQAIYKSVDDGENWMPFQLETAKKISVITYSMNESNTLYMGFRKK